MLVMVQSVKMAILCELVMIRIGIRVATLSGQGTEGRPSYPLRCKAIRGSINRIQRKGSNFSLIRPLPAIKPIFTQE